MSAAVAPEFSLVEGGRSALPCVLIAGFAGALGSGLRAVVAREVGLQPVGNDDGNLDIGEALTRHRPAVALINEGALRSMVELRRLSLAHPETGLVVVVMHLSRERDDRLLESGARVVLPLTVDGTELGAVLRLVGQGLIGPPRQGAGGAARLGLLTSRETEILELLVRRRTAREIAEALNVTVATVNTHCRRIYSKLGVRGRRGLEQCAGELLGVDARGAEDGPARDRAPFRRLFTAPFDRGWPAGFGIRVLSR